MRINLKHFILFCSVIILSFFFYSSIKYDRLNESLYTKEFVPSKDNVKFIGRTYLYKDTLWLSYSASGIEFTFTGTKAAITFVGDNIVNSNNDDNYCRIAIYVNDEIVTDELLSDHKKTITAFHSTSEKTVTIRVLKLSETLSSTVGIDNISIMSNGSIKPTEAKPHRIEFIGDSITCGYGIESTAVHGTFTTATENVVKTYAYKTASALNTDLSIVAFSGFGIISGHTSNGKRVYNQLVPTYYNTMGFSMGLFNSTILVNRLYWDFSRYQPELIIVNLGTNDKSYCKNNKERQEEFVIGYVAFLKQIREKNPKSTVLCTLGMMGDTLYPSIEKAVSLYTTETNDTKVFTMRFEKQKDTDGYGLHKHPSESTHTKAADKLTKVIRSLMGW